MQALIGFKIYNLLMSQTIIRNPCHVNTSRLYRYVTVQFTTVVNLLLILINLQLTMMLKLTDAITSPAMTTLKL